MKVIIGIDPSSSSTGVCVLNKKGIDPEFAFQVTDMKPKNCLSVLKKIREKYKGYEIFVAQEEWSIQVGEGSHLRIIRLLERSGERWSCLAECLDMKVHRILNQKWHSHFSIKGNRAGAGVDTKFQSVDKVLSFYPELVSLGVKIGPDLADCILIAKYLEDTMGILA